MRQTITLYLLLALGITTLLEGGCANKEALIPAETAAPATLSASPAPSVAVETPKPLVQQQAPSASLAEKSAETIVLPASMGTVMFPHRKHQEMLKDCSACHAQAPGKIAELGKDWAHNTCRGCHSDMQKGPSACSGCHKK